MSKLFKMPLTLIVAFTMVLILALPAVASTDVPVDQDLDDDIIIDDEDIEDDDLIIDDDDVVDDKIIGDDDEAPKAGDATSSALLLCGASVVLVAGALAFAVKRARSN